MADEITVKTTSESETNPAGTAPPGQTVSFNRVHLVNLCAVGLGVSFFLPWAAILGVPISGFTLQKAGDQERLLWAIPIMSILTIVAGLAKSSQKYIGQLTGLLPFCVGAYWLYNLGSDLFGALQYGAYFSLLFGAGLFILPRKSQ